MQNCAQAKLEQSHLQLWRVEEDIEQAHEQEPKCKGERKQDEKVANTTIAHTTETTTI